MIRTSLLFHPVLVISTFINLIVFARRLGSNTSDTPVNFQCCGRPPNHPWLKTGSPESFLACRNYFYVSLKDIFFLVFNTKCACLIMFPLSESWVAYRATSGIMFGSPDQIMGRVWRLGDLLPTALLSQWLVLSDSISNGFETSTFKDKVSYCYVHKGPGSVSRVTHISTKWILDQIWHDC